MVTMVDAFNFFKNLQSVESLKDRGEAASPEDQRNVANLLADQIEFAGTLVAQYSVFTFSSIRCCDPQ